MTNTFKLDGWKFSTIILMVLLIISWVWMLITSMINDSTMQIVRSQQSQVRELTDKTVTIEMQILDLQSRNKALNDRIEAFNTLRQRDHEYLQNQINRGPVKAIR